jgi:hypothetical protein
MFDDSKQCLDVNRDPLAICQYTLRLSFEHIAGTGEEHGLVQKAHGFQETGYEETPPGLWLSAEDYALESIARGMGSASLNWFHFKSSAKGQNPRAACPVGSKRVW